ncbi:hypothetical protein RZS08_58640, partial [Arthrospira platensis SPKY1]|nr:hypothetical protein [Arthrospira platensis SPKY1]
IQCMDAPFTLEDNVITQLTGRSALGIVGERSVGTITNNSIGPLQGILTSNSNQVVTGIAISDSSAVISANHVSTLGNGASGSNAFVRGLHVTNTTAWAMDNT